MKNIQDLIAMLQASSTGTVNINIIMNNDDVPVAPAAPAPELPDTDFAVGDRVLVCHIRKSGERVHTVGEVTTVLGRDDKGWYTRVTGDNGKHYRAGLTYNAERLGTIIYNLD